MLVWSDLWQKSCTRPGNNSPGKRNPERDPISLVENQYNICT